MKNLGKLLLLLHFFTTLTFAYVNVSVDANTIEQGDEVILTIEGDKDFDKPSINELCGVNITSTSQKSSIEMINGSYSKKVLYLYNFRPEKSCTVEPITINVDGKSVVSKKIAIKVVPRKVNKNADFSLELKSDKSSLYVGEPLKVTLLVKQKQSARALDSKFEEPTFKDFWKKTQTKPKTYRNGLYNITEIDYVLAPQKVGSFEINPAKLHIAVRDDRRDAWGQFFTSMKWKSYFSNSLKVDVKALPSDVDLIGSFKISLKVSKREVNANEATNATLVIEGSGNFEDIPSMKPNIFNITTYDEEPKVTEGVRGGKTVGRWSQKFAFVADSNFTIPAFKLKYFDLQTKKIREIKTDAVDIVVHNSSLVPAYAPSNSVKIERGANSNTQVDEKQNRSNISYLLLVFVSLVSMLFGVLLAKLPYDKIFKKEAKSSKVSHKDLKAVLALLFEHKDNAKVSIMIEKIEKKLYNGETVDIDTKELKELIKRYSS